MKRNLVGKILGKIKIFVQDFVPIRTALLWEQNLVKKSLILAQDFQMAAVTKILMRRDKSIAPLLSLGDNKQKTLEIQKRTR